MIPNSWQSIFASSPASSGYYDETVLPHCIWDWPKGTWFQERRDYLREHAPTARPAGNNPGRVCGERL